MMDAAKARGQKLLDDMAKPVDELRDRLAQVKRAVAGLRLAIIALLAMQALTLAATVVLIGLVFSRQG